MPIEDFIDTKPESEERSGWIVTFASLMALLMCFFVLLLSFSSMDVQKYQRVAATMRVSTMLGLSCSKTDSSSQGKVS